MAQKVQILLESDIDGAPADETVTFGLDASDYEIDLTSAQAQGLRDALAPYIAAGRKVARGNRRTRSTSAPKTSTGPNLREVRDWARSNGYTDVPERGRVPQAILDAFETKTPAPKAPKAEKGGKEKEPVAAAS